MQKLLFAEGLSCNPGVSPPSYHLNCQNVQIYMVIRSLMATSPGKVILNKPPGCFAACIWRTASVTRHGALHVVAGEQTPVPSIFYPPAALITLSVPVCDTASRSRFWICPVV